MHATSVVLSVITTWYCITFLILQYLVKSDNGVRQAVKLRVNSVLCSTRTVIAHYENAEKHCNYDLCWIIPRRCWQHWVSAKLFCCWTLFLCGGEPGNKATAHWVFGCTVYTAGVNARLPGASLGYSTSCYTPLTICGQSSIRLQVDWLENWVSGMLESGSKEAKMLGCSPAESMLPDPWHIHVLRSWCHLSGTSVNVVCRSKCMFCGGLLYSLYLLTRLGWRSEYVAMVYDFRLKLAPFLSQYGWSALKPIISSSISKEQTNIVHGFVAVARMRGMHSVSVTSNIDPIV